MKKLLAIMVLLTFVPACQNSSPSTHGTSEPVYSTRPVPKPVDPVHNPDDDGSYASMVVDLVNQARGNRLKVDVDLTAEAQSYVVAMARAGQLTHSLYGQSLGTRLAAIKYVYTAAGENIAEGQSTPGAVVKAWLNSPGHRQNIMNKTYTVTGVGSHKDLHGQWWWVQVFARKAGSNFSATKSKPEIHCPDGLK